MKAVLNLLLFSSQSQIILSIKCDEDVEATHLEGSSFEDGHLETLVQPESNERDQEPI
jgi:hypothetical protein